MSDIALHRSIGEIKAVAWDALFPGQAEAHAYLGAVERAGLDGFELFYVTVREGERIAAAAPGFVTEYELDATVQGPVKAAVRAVRTVWPRFLKLKLCCLGSPVTETAGLGLDATADAAERARLTGLLLQGLALKGKAAGARLTAVKDVPRADAISLAAAERAGLNPMASLPTAVLDLDGVSEDSWWASLSHATRKDLRRKLKRASGLAVERVRDLAPYAARIDALYAATRARSELQFERLDWRFFQAVLDAMGEDAACVLYKLGDEAIAFNLLVASAETVVDKYFCADHRGPEHNLYFVSWIENLRYALSRNARSLVAGQACYEPKLRLGCRLEPTAILFRHAWPPVNAALKLASRVLDVEHTDPALKTAKAKARTGASRRPGASVQAAAPEPRRATIPLRPSGPPSPQGEDQHLAA